MNAVRKWFKRRSNEPQRQQRRRARPSEEAAAVQSPPEEEEEPPPPRQDGDDVNFIREEIIREQYPQYNHNGNVYQDEHYNEEAPHSCWSLICDCLGQCFSRIRTPTTTTTTPRHSKHDWRKMESLTTDTAPGTPLSAAGSIARDMNMLTETTPLLLQQQLPPPQLLPNINDVKYHDNSRDNTHKKNDNLDQEAINVNDDTNMMVVLVLDTSVRRFELVALPRTVNMTVGQVLQGILPEAIQDEQLQTLTFTGLMPLDSKAVFKSARLRTYTIPRQRLPSNTTTIRTTTTTNTLWVALTPSLTAFQAKHHARSLLQHSAVQSTVRTHVLCFLACVCVCFDV